MKDKEGIAITNAFQKILKESNQGRQSQSEGRKPTKTWLDKGSKFYNISFKNWLKDNNIEMYSIYNEEKSVIAETFIKTFKTKIYKYITSISKNVCIKNESIFSKSV